MTRNRILKTGFGLAVVAVVAYYFTTALRRNWGTLDQANLSLDWWALWAVLAFVSAVAVSGALWGSILAQLHGSHPGLIESVRVHCASWLLKYVPGQIGFVVNKVLWGQRRKLSRIMVLISVAYENVFLLIGSLVPTLAIVMIAQSGAIDGSQSAWWWIVLAVVPLALVLSPPIFRRAVAVIARLTIKREVAPEYFLSAGKTWQFQSLYLIPRVLNGIGIAIIASAMVGAPAHTWVALGAAYAIAGALGILAVFVPSGLGVREAAFAAFAAPFIGVEMAIVVAIAARVLATVADAVVAAIYGTITMSIRRKANHD